MRASTTRTIRLLSAVGSLLLAGLVLCGVPQGAAAEEVDTLGGRLPFPSGRKCFSRTFDESHMKAHPNQRITSISLLISTGEDDKYKYWPYMVVVRLKGAKGAFWQGDSCEFRKGAFRCPVSCDGGEFYLAVPETGSGLRLDVDKNYLLQGGCGDNRKPVFLSAKTEEPSYALEAREMKVCASQIPASREAREWFKDLMSLKPPPAQGKSKSLAK